MTLMQYLRHAQFLLKQTAAPWRDVRGSHCAASGSPVTMANPCTRDDAVRTGIGVRPVQTMSAAGVYDACSRGMHSTLLSSSRMRLYACVLMDAVRRTCALHGFMDDVSSCTAHARRRKPWQACVYCCCLATAIACMSFWLVRMDIAT